MSMITTLAPNQIFVFGSNLAGIHGAGAARQARKQFGAAIGIGEGLTGRSYACNSFSALHVAALHESALRMSALHVSARTALQVSVADLIQVAMP